MDFWGFSGGMASRRAFSKSLFTRSVSPQLTVHCETSNVATTLRVHGRNSPRELSSSMPVGDSVGRVDHSPGPLPLGRREETDLGPDIQTDYRLFAFHICDVDTTPPPPPRPPCIKLANLDSHINRSTEDELQSSWEHGTKGVCSWSRRVWIWKRIWTLQ